VLAYKLVICLQWRAFMDKAAQRTATTIPRIQEIESLIRRSIELTNSNDLDKLAALQE